MRAGFGNLIGTHCKSMWLLHHAQDGRGRQIFEVIASGAEGANYDRTT